MNTIRIITVTLITMVAAHAGAAELVLLLKKGADSVGEKVGYAQTLNRSGNMELVRVGDDEVEAAIALFEQRPEVISAERNITFTTPEPIKQPAGTRAFSIVDDPTDVTFNDPLFPQQFTWSENSAENPAGSSVALAVSRAETYKPTTVVVIDSGFTPSSPIQWQDGYNFIDDSTHANGLEPGPSFRTTATDCSPHGQQVASIIGGIQGDGMGNTGVLSDARFYAARVLNCHGTGGQLMTFASAIRWAVGESVTDEAGNPVPTITDLGGQPADLINLSLGATASCSTALQSAIDAANAAGAIISVAAGNTSLGEPGTSTDADITTPANCDGVVTVAGVNDQGEPSLFSSSGNTVDISAGSEDIPVFDGVESVLVTGTSFASPLVGGIIANLIQDVPGLSNTTVRGLIPNAVNPIANPDGLDLKMGAGIIDARKLQDAAVALIDPPEFEVRHPAGGNCGAAQMLDLLAGQQGQSVCDLREIRVSSDPAGEGAYAVVYELDPDAPQVAGSGQVFKASQASRFLLNGWSQSKKYGIAKCDGPDGSGCAADKPLIPLNLQDVPTQCSNSLIAQRAL